MRENVAIAFVCQRDPKVFDSVSNRTDWAADLTISAQVRTLLASKRSPSSSNNHAPSIKALKNANWVAFRLSGVSVNKSGDQSTNGKTLGSKTTNPRASSELFMLLRTAINSAL